MFKPALSLGAFFAGLGVILGAFGAHGLKKFLDIDQLQIFETGVRYQMYHAFALLITGVAFQYAPFKPLKLATAFFLIGILLFSGSLYSMTFLKIQGQVGLGGLGIITPIGGVFFILGWLMLMLGVVRRKA
jgi:uncharacterized membrane protein YgdD (TMEM256/DUF423 family)